MYPSMHFASSSADVGRYEPDSQPLSFCYCVTKVCFEIFFKLEINPLDFLI